MKKDRIIFLDIDGVLNTEHSKGIGINIVEDRVELLSQITAATNATIVLTSTWRHNISKTFLGYKGENKDTKLLLQLFKQYGITRFSIFPNIPGENRAERISNYIAKYKVNKFVILDDEDFGFDAFCKDGQFIKTEFFGNPSETGLLSSMQDVIIAKLK